jgi:hypothetical protein
MRRIFIAALVGLLIVAIAPIGRTDDTKLSLVRVKVDNRTEGMFIAHHFDETHVYDPGYVHVLLWAGDRAELDAFGYSYETLIEDVVAHDRALFEQAEATATPVPLPGPDRDSYRALADYNTELQRLAKKNPSMVDLFKLKHLTHEDREVFGIEIARNVKSDDGRPVFYVDGVHHAREWPAGEYPMIFAHYLVDKYGKDDEVTRLLNQGRVIIVPIMNVDGFDFSRSSVLGAQSNVDAAHGTACGIAHCEAYWRKNRLSYTGLTVPVVQKNPDAYGVDPNRNYSYHWGGGGSSNSTLPAGDQTYRGAEPQSEPETKNISELLLKKSVTSIITNHTYSRLVLRPWGDTSRPSPDEDYLFALGARMSKAMGGYQNIKGIQLYITTGTMSEWGYGTFGIPSYTFEHGRAFHPPYTGCESDCVEAEWKGVMKALMIAGEAALDERAHGVVTGRVENGAGRAVEATLTVTKKFANPLAPNNPIGKDSWPHAYKNTIDASGAFEWHLPPSTRPHLKEQGKTETYRLTISADGLGSKTFTFVLKQGQKLNLGTIRL